MGGGPMPSFAGQISDADIGKLADYIVAVNHKGAAVAAAPSAAPAKQ
jgi:mono/diheme cytochrome c family protein